MTPAAAADLAVRFAQMWPRHIPAREWEEELVGLDDGAAGTTFARLKRDSERPPTIAQFYAVYRTLNTTDASTARRPDCGHCENHGWKPALDQAGHEHGVEPCHCQHGDDRRAVHQAVITHNHTELDRLFPGRHNPRTTRSPAA